MDTSRDNKRSKSHKKRKRRHSSHDRRDRSSSQQSDLGNRSERSRGKRSPNRVVTQGSADDAHRNHKHVRSDTEHRHPSSSRACTTTRQHGESTETDFKVRSTSTSSRRDQSGTNGETQLRIDGIKKDSNKVVKSIVKDNDESYIQSSKQKGKESSVIVDWDFDFTEHKTSLNRLFFSRENDIIQINTKECDDFWDFVKRYQTIRRKKGAQKSYSQVNQGRFDLPVPYDTKHRIAVTIKNDEVDYYIDRGKQFDKALTSCRLAQFRDILRYYVDFCQKERFTKLLKIRKDQQNLPIYQYRAAILQTVSEHQVVVVAGDTGCGKSTQMPQYLMEVGYENVACTQPRRIACISLSKRVAYETLNEFGSKVGYQVRFDKSKTAATKILFLTEGLLLRQLSLDQLLPQYNVIVIDEVHERHVHTDFLLGVLKCLIRHRADIKVILMSATINITLFSSFFNNCPVVKVPGRLYPIELEYCQVSREEESGKTERLNPRPYLRVMQKIDHKYPSGERGDLLIFSSGLSEITAIADAARDYASKTKRWIVLPLHSTLSSEDQDKVFDVAPEGVRKCIIATNIAETSITIDGVRFIIDSGKVKEISYDAQTKMQRLREFPISRASAEQRKGRAGRTGPGVCFRLYDESTYTEFQDYSTPEIQRVSLVSIILQMLSMGLPDARRFPFIEPPSEESVENAVLTLKEQGALTQNEQLTPMGHMLSSLPVDVTIGKMLVMGSVFHMMAPVLTIAAAMSVQSPFTHKAHSDHDAMVARRSLESDHGDPITLMNVFDAWIIAKSDGNNSRKWCKRRGLEEQRLYEMVKLRRQFQDMMIDQKLMAADDSTSDKYETSDQRRQRSGQRRRLGQLKRKHDRQRKIVKTLRMDDDTFQISSGDEAAPGEDIQDLELRLTHNLDELQRLSNNSDSYSGRDISLLKLILSSGLYPQVAIADETNSYRKDSELVYHTRDKQFVLLHPTSSFQNHVDVLAPKCSDRESAESRRYKFSLRHEILTYVSLLETNKPYLITSMRIPALQILLLFSNSLDSNSDFTRILCDGWLELEFRDCQGAEEMLSRAVYLRSAWYNLLSLRLQQNDKQVDEVARKRRESTVEKILAEKLSEFLVNSAEYTIRRVLPAELKTCYTGYGQSGDDTMADCHPTKGGLVITDYLVYDCLVSECTSTSNEYSALMPRTWTCQLCEVELTVTTAMKIQHLAQCQCHKEEESFQNRESELERETNLNPMRKRFHCDVCEKDFAMTATEILKHKRSHTNTELNVKQ